MISSGRPLVPVQISKRVNEVLHKKEGEEVVIGFRARSEGTLDFLGRPDLGPLTSSEEFKFLTTPITGQYNLRSDGDRSLILTKLPVELLIGNENG